MKKRYILPILGAVAIFLSINIYQKRRLRKTLEKLSIRNAGVPDEVDRVDDTQLENSKMVAEGSQYGVQYYNELIDQ